MESFACYFFIIYLLLLFFYFCRQVELLPNDKGKSEEWKIVLLHDRGTL